MRRLAHFWSVQWDLRGQPPYVAETLPHPSVHLIFERGVLLDQRRNFFLRAGLKEFAHTRQAQLLDGRRGLARALADIARFNTG